VSFSDIHMVGTPLAHAPLPCQGKCLDHDSDSDESPGSTVSHNFFPCVTTFKP